MFLKWLFWTQFPIKSFPCIKKSVRYFQTNHCPIFLNENVSENQNVIKINFDEFPK